MAKSDTHTAIWISKALIEKVKTLKLCPDETYDHTIDRLISRGHTIVQEKKDGEQ